MLSLVNCYLESELISCQGNRDNVEQCFCSRSQIEASGYRSSLRLSNVSSLDHNKKIACQAENIVGEKESSLVLNILCRFACGEVTIKSCKNNQIFSICTFTLVL